MDNDENKMLWILIGILEARNILTSEDITMINEGTPEDANTLYRKLRNIE